jgi:acetyl esterase/lipase
MLTQRRLLTVPLAVLLLGDLATAENLPPGVEVVRNKSYGGSGTSNLLDLYLPAKSPDPVPLVIWIHGGGWESRDKQTWPAIFLVDKGFAVASINYRLSQEAKFPAQIHDCKAAVRWLRANAKTYRLDPERFGVWGGSAGGHLAALLGTSGEDKTMDGSVGKHLKVSSRVQAVCDWFGPTDLEQLAAFQATFPGLPIDYPKTAVLKLLGTSKGIKARAVKANPITFVSEKAPPFLIMHGDGDRLVPLQQSRILESALKKARAQVELRVVPGADHGLFNDHGSLRAVEQFFSRTLKPHAPDAKDVHVVATYNHGAADRQLAPLSFYSNGRIESADSLNTWSLSGNKLSLCWYVQSGPPFGVWVDSCVLAKDEKGYRGTNQQGDRIVGEKVSGDLKRAR